MRGATSIAHLHGTPVVPELQPRRQRERTPTRQTVLTMTTLRVTAVRKALDDSLYDRTLDIFEVHYDVAPIEVVDRSRVYIMDAADGASGSQQMMSMLDSAHIAG